MLRSVVKSGIKSSILAFDKVKYGLGCLKEDLEDIAAEAKSELKEKTNFSHVETVSTETESEAQKTPKKNVQKSKNNNKNNTSQETAV